MIQTLRPGQVSPVYFSIEIPGGRTAIPGTTWHRYVPATYDATSLDNQADWRIVSQSHRFDGNHFEVDVTAQNIAGGSSDCIAVLSLHEDPPPQDTVHRAQKSTVAHGVASGATTTFTLREYFGDAGGYSHHVLTLMSDPDAATPTPSRTATPTHTATPHQAGRGHCYLPLIVRDPAPILPTSTPTCTSTPQPPTPTPTPTQALAGPWINTWNEAEVRAAYAATLGSSAPAINWTGSIASCSPGDTSAAFKQDVVDAVNFFRNMAGVQDIQGLNSDWNNQAQKAALMFAANDSLSHDPPSSWSCYSSDGDNAAGNSNISLGNAGRDAVEAYMDDDSTTHVGHRRWILYPQTQHMGTGDTTGASWHDEANCLWVFDHPNMWSARPTTRDPYVAWPPQGYVPVNLIYDSWSFSVAGADFGSANVSVSKNGSGRSVSSWAAGSGYGENTLVWTISGDTPSAGDVYDVTVAGFKVGGVPQSYSYQVRVIGT